MRFVALVVLLVLAPASDAFAQQSDARTVARLRERPAARMKLVSRRFPQAGRKHCFTGMDGFLTATKATAILALPVAGLAGVIAGDGWRAARWATYAGAGYSYGMTAYMSTQPCESSDALAYIWVPFAAAGGAIVASTR